MENNSMELLMTNQYTFKQWMQFYKNTWQRNLTARCIDLQSDIALKAKDPETPVVTEDGQTVPVKIRLEYRKIVVQDALDLIASIDAMIAMTDEQFAAFISPEGLAIAPDVIAPSAKVGDACTTPDNKAGTFQEENGQLICIPTEATPAPAEAQTTTPPDATVAPAAPTL